MKTMKKMKMNASNLQSIRAQSLFITFVVIVCVFLSSAQVRAQTGDVARFDLERTKIDESIAMAIALSHADVGTNRTLKVSFATGFYDKAVAIAGMVGYRPGPPGITIRGGVAYGVDGEEYSGTIGVAANW